MSEQRRIKLMVSVRVIVAILSSIAIVAVFGWLVNRINLG